MAKTEKKTDTSLSSALNPTRYFNGLQKSLGKILPSVLGTPNMFTQAGSSSLIKESRANVLKRYVTGCDKLRARIFIY